MSGHFNDNEKTADVRNLDELDLEQTRQYDESFLRSLADKFKADLAIWFANDSVPNLAELSALQVECQNFSDAAHALESTYNLLNSKQGKSVATSLEQSEAELALRRGIDWTRP